MIWLLPGRPGITCVIRSCGALAGRDTVHTEFESDAAAAVLLQLEQEFRPSSSPIKLGVSTSTLHASAASPARDIERGGGRTANNKALFKLNRAGGKTSKTRLTGLSAGKLHPLLARFPHPITG